jgi:hypothetical protein
MAKQKITLPRTITGQLTHRKIYLFGATQSGQITTSCHVCLDRHSVFSIAIDAAGTEHRCCLRCLHKFGGKEQIDHASRRSRYAALVWNCIEALDQLRAEFPDMMRRPYGEKILLKTIECPSLEDNDAERIVRKIKARAWTEYDVARIHGGPEPPSRNLG